MTSQSANSRSISLHLPAALSAWRRPVLGALSIWIAVRAVVVGWALIVHALQPTGSTYFAQPNWFYTLFFHWDSNYFEGIARTGYFASGTPVRWEAFFPGYPLAARGFAALIWGPHLTTTRIDIALWLVSAVASAVAAALLWRLVEDRYGVKVAAGATALFLAGPYSLFLVASYSEALFVVFAIGAWLAATRGHWLASGILAALAGMTRINGLFLVAALAVLFIGVQRKQGKPFLARTVGLVGIGLSGVLGYFVYLFIMTGDPSAWTHAQSVGWHRALNWPWDTLLRTIGQVLYDPVPAWRLQAALDIVFAVLLVTATVIMARRRLWAEAIMVGLTALSMMTSTTYMSLARDSIVLFPLVILVATTLVSPRRKWIFWVALALGCVVLLINVHQFTLGQWTD
ncbi:MAG TPA: mannosyltransferase family protein [Microbacteriaceae bacterium]|nr:mannosyltransferase family protein [Microbacteriaceae bacterium]